ncbi:MAG: TIR domain-containing protein [Nostoc sp.]|uniref:HD domain-containing protein n=1 Tax=Nostoc sp. TaxID=1180 RepID=UPI002FF9085B
MSKQFEYDVFISYKRDDVKFVKNIIEKLQQNELKVWWDEEGIPLGTVFEEKIGTAIRKSKSALIFFGSNGVGTTQDEEIRVINNENRERNKVDGELLRISILLPDVKEVPQSYPFLRTINWINFNNFNDEIAFNRLLSGIPKDHNNQTYKQTELYQALQRINSSESKSVEDTLTQIFTKLQQFLSPPEPSTADTFTLYDPERGDRVAQRMADVISPSLLPKDEKPELSADELELLLLSAYLLDICLTPKYGKVSLYHHYLLRKPEEHGLSDQEIEDFQKWLDDEPEGVEAPLWQGEGEPDEKTKRLADRLITYYCYDRHKDWSITWIEESLNQEVPDKRVRDNLMLLCKSPYLKNKDKEIADNPLVTNSNPIQGLRLRYLIAVVQAANILAFDPVQIPDVILQDYNINSTELIYWWKNDKYVKYPATVSKLKDKSQISLLIYPKKAIIHRASEILANEMDHVLTDCYKLLEGTDTKNLWDLQIAIQRNIIPDNYEYIDGAFRPDTNKILELLSGISLYGDHLYAVRELLQNAFDAVREEIAYKRLKEIKDVANRQSLNLQHSVNLKIEKDSDGIWLVCTDDGVGMTKDIIQNYLLVSGSARQRKIINLERECQKYGFSVGRTGKFGIGVLSYFMLAERVVIKTRRSLSPGDDDNHGWKFETEGIGSFGELTNIQKNSHGTEIRLLLKPEVISTVISKKEDSSVQKQEIFKKNLSQENLSEFVSKLKSFLQNVLDYIPCNFNFISDFPEKKLEFKPGWICKKDAFYKEIEKDFTKFLAQWRDSNNSSEEAENFYVSSYREKLKECLKWKIKEGELPNNLGKYRVYLPYFELNNQVSFAFLETAESTEIILKEFKYNHSHFYIVDCKSQRISWKGMNFSISSHMRNAYTGKRSFSTNMLVTIDLTPYSTSHQEINLEVNRNDVKIDNSVKERINIFLTNEFDDFIQEFLNNHKTSPYALLNYQIARKHEITNSLISDNTSLYWLFKENNQIKWQTLKAPLISDKAHSNKQDFIWNKEQINKPLYVYESDGQNRYHNRHNNISWQVPNIPPNKIVAQYLSDKEIEKLSEYRETERKFLQLEDSYFDDDDKLPNDDDKLPNSEIINLRFEALWIEELSPQSERHPLVWTSQFPPGEWQKLCCVKMDFFRVWNNHHRLVKAIDEEGWKWCEKKLKESYDNYNEFCKLTEELSNNESYAAAFLVNLLQGNFVIEKRRMNNNLKKEWDKICNECPDMMKTLWQLVFKEDITPQNATPIYQWEYNELIVVTPYEWKEYSKRSDVDTYLPNPDPEWCITVNLNEERSN